MDKHLDQVHIRPFLIMGRSPLLVSGMNQEVLGRLEIKIRGLTYSPHLYFFPSSNLSNMKRLSAYQSRIS
jgi:hypothetical protein